MVLSVGLAVIALVALAGLGVSLLGSAGPGVRSASFAALGFAVGAAAVIALAGPSAVLGGTNRVTYDTLYVQMVSDSGDTVCLGTAREPSPEDDQTCANVIVADASGVQTGQRVRVAIADVRPPDDVAADDGPALLHLEPADS